MSAVEVLHSFVHLALTPYLDAYSRTQTSKDINQNKLDHDLKSGVPATRKKLAELELSLRHLQQNIEIPQLILPLPRKIEETLQRCEEKGLRVGIEALPQTDVSDSAFLVEINNTVNVWIKSIQTITRMSRDPESGSAAQERNFWLHMELALEDIEKQLSSDGVRLTMEVLKQAKRYQATTSFSADTGLKDASEKVQRYNQLMREFPIDELDGATSLVKVQDALVAIFNHLNRRLRVTPYPISRALPLVSAISGDLENRMRELLHGGTLMQLEYRDFQSTIRAANSVWQVWDDNRREFTNVARDVTRKKNEKFIPIKVTERHTKLQERLEYINTFRINHEQLRQTIINVIGSPQSKSKPSENPNFQVAVAEEYGETDAVAEVEQAYTSLTDVDVLDITVEGTQRWTQAEALYNDRTSRVENAIISRLRDRLATAKTSNEMFRVFSQFNALFIRPKIRGAIQEYQVRLIDKVKEDITILQRRFKQQYGHSEAHAMAQLRDLPPVAGAIIWARQIEKQLDELMKRVEAVLGQDWMLHADGEKLHAESASFRDKLNTRPIFESWLHDVARRRIALKGRLFGMMKNRSLGNVLELTISFDAQVIALFKEVRNLTWLNYQIPHAISTVSKDARRVYPFAVSLMESVRIIAQTNRTIGSISDIKILLNGFERDMQVLISRGVAIKWESFVYTYELQLQQNTSKSAHAANKSASAPRGESKHSKYVRDFASAAATLQTKTNILVEVNDTIQEAKSDLETCPYSSPSFRSAIERIQTAVDQLNLEKYSNLQLWVSRLNHSIEETLTARLRKATKTWIEHFESPDDISGSLQPASGPEAVAERPHQALLTHEITMQNQTIFLTPPAHFARAHWLSEFHRWLEIVCDLPKVVSSRFEMKINLSSKRSTTPKFEHILSNCIDDLQATYRRIDARYTEISQYVRQWLEYQSLWDLQSEQVSAQLGDDLSLWLQLLQEIRINRKTFDTSESRQRFGNLVVEYEQVQMKVNAKYDSWQRDILLQFASRLGDRMRELSAGIDRARQDLESQNLETSSTAQAVTFITVVQQCKKKVDLWRPEIETSRQGQHHLTRERYSFPKDWLHIDQIDHAWSILDELLSRKVKLVDDQSDALRAKTMAEDKVVNEKITTTTTLWNDEKPISGKIAPDQALSTLSSFQNRIATLQTDADLVAKAKEALDIPRGQTKDLSAVSEEIQDFISVWSALSTIWNNIQELKESLWSALQPRKLRGSLDSLIRTTKEMPSRMRQYAAFDYAQSSLRNYLKICPLLTDLKSEAVRERHWIKIFKTLKPGSRYSAVSLTLGDVWDLQLSVSEPAIRDIIVQAQGEMALEEFIKQVRDTWQNYSLDLVNYQNKCRLIRGWDDLFARCSENLNSLQAMRHSPYYKEFEEEASSWEDKLNRVHVLFDVWIDVQRQWVYLEGVFAGNADIKHLLPVESSRFQNINSEFFAVLKKVQKSPFVLDVLNISGIQKSLERLADLLNKIQKALGEYLEKERMAFPRFYFVGDEDLLEIIGNSDDIVRISKHFRKMFAGISGLLLDDEEGNIAGFTSKEGEEVSLKRPISTTQIPKINEWLAALELEMKSTLAENLADAIQQFGNFYLDDVDGQDRLREYIAGWPAQVLVLGTQVVWTNEVEKSLNSGGSGLDDLQQATVRLLDHLAAAVLEDLDALSRRKCEHLITEFVHQRDTIQTLLTAGADSADHHLWLIQMRFCYSTEGDHVGRLRVRMANADLLYGFEYLGVPERLVRTPLTDRCFLTLTQALAQRLGGSPYGPAGTGKTESVKALGLQLGRFTLVFCCDDTFDFQAMGRIFLGICRVGAWGCFDEFNRLEERILSAVSQQVQNIQLGLRRGANLEGSTIELAGRNFEVNASTGIFITMNPGYAGRSNLPDNLKKLFRSVAMSKPDKELIAEVMLYSQGFRRAKPLARQTVPFFDQCAARLSKQAHYDFGLRALKSVLISSGGLKRLRLTDASLDSGAEATLEPQILIQSIRETIAPKLLRQDTEVMSTIEAEAFPGVQYIPAKLQELEQAIHNVASQAHLESNDIWMTKVLQLYQIQAIHHGVMMVGESGSGKSAIWKTLLQALQKMEGREGVFHIIDSKVMSKETLYGTLDSTTREWTDGLFTSILRKIVDNLRGEDTKRHWIVFDGDVDPEWVENLNSVLDDNKILTLPNGERLGLPPNVRILFEVETLKYATLATVSRCGMVWFSSDTITSNMMVQNYLERLRSVAFEDVDEDSASQSGSQILQLQQHFADLLEHHLNNADLLKNALSQAQQLDHIMQFTEIRALTTLFSLVNSSCRSVLQYNLQHNDFPLDPEQVESYLTKKLILALVWAFAGDAPIEERKSFGDRLASLTTLDMPNSSLIDYDVSLPRAEWVTWQSQVPTVDINTHSVTETDVVIPTLDTVRHEDILYSWLAEHKPLILCGPPGSGKTMTLFSALRKLPNMEVVGLNFSSATTPELILKTFDQYCEYRKTLNGVIMSPTQIGRWLVVFCDEINLPAPDKYGTQRAISFLRQLIEQNGFWRSTDKNWISLERIQFVGACNPPTDAGRTPFSSRFLRHSPIVMVDYPEEISLNQIYGTFNSAILKIIPNLRGYSEALTKAMVQVYLESQKRFTPKIQPHYVYSPRELTRWVRGLYEAIKPLETLSVEGLVRIWAHEALRLFQDRLVEEDECKWTLESIHSVSREHFPNIDENAALGGPILYSNWLSKNYVPVEREQLRDFVKARLRTFCEEEVDVPLVLFNDVLEHVLRIDRVFRQPQGHLILIGVSGSGKTTLSRFVAWMNGLKVFQIKVHGKYTAADFDEDLRDILRRTGCRGEKICFILDESNVLDSGFLERMNTLLANAEVPGLFEGDDYAALMTSCKEGAQRQGLLLDSQDELYKWFTQQISKNLHVVFTMNPPEEGLSSKAATSPALFNRCVLNWFGDWSDQALFQVGLELTQPVDLDIPAFAAPDTIPVAYRDLSLPANYRDTVVNAMVYVHHSMTVFNQRLFKQQGRMTYLTPRHYLDFVSHYVKLYNEKRDDLEEQQRHLNIGLDKLRDTVEKVQELRASLAQKKGQLEQKDSEANEKLQQMMVNQREAERRKAISLKIQGSLATQEKEVTRRQEIVNADLAKAEPAVLSAKESVSNIKRQQLTEVRSMGNPPSGVKLALEAVCTLLGHKVDSWKTIQGIVRRDDFIASIVGYDNEKQMTKNHRVKMQNEYLSSDDFTYEKVNRASKACGPLVQWVEAQVNYSAILDRIGPLRAEAEELEEKTLQTRAEAQAVEGQITQLEQSIALYKAEYASLISETQSIKTEMSRVETRVSRSVKLLDSLSSERSRWENGSKMFETQISTIIGDVLVAAAFIAYGGFYDQQFRKSMVDDWLGQLALSGISYKTHNAMTEYLSSADERLSWHQHGLPVDELCSENAIILRRFNRYPLIIDPSGRATRFLEQEHQERRLTITSFLDDGFVKQLESSLRFGNPLLIQDAEHLDPILNHVLNKEYQKTGGRVLIQLGKQEIDFSPAFRLYLSTRDPSATFSPDIASRTTLVNFTVTRSSLQTQSLDEVLKSERPDIDQRRNNLIKMQGEFTTHLRGLEKRLLRALNESRGNILDDDIVIETLETLKKEAAEISVKMAETEGVMVEVDKISTQYASIAQACSAVFAILEQLHYLNHFYQFSLQYFIDIFASVLHDNPKLHAQQDHSARGQIILQDIFVRTYTRVAPTLLNKDRITFAILLANASPFFTQKDTLNLILDKSIAGHDVSGNNALQAKLLDECKALAPLKDYLAAVSAREMDKFLTEELAEKFVPTSPIDTTALDFEAISLLLVKLFRVDRFVPASEKFVCTVFGSDFLQSMEGLGDIVERATSVQPIALVSNPGFDASYKVDNLVAARHAQCSSIAMGSNEGTDSAEKAISNAASSGAWVLVKNVHLAQGWLQSLEKRLTSLKPHPDFRLFLSMESSPKIPVNLLRASRVLMYEQPAGIRANMRDSLSLVTSRATKPPVEKARLYLLLSFLHAIIQERLRYAPIMGWRSSWEFNDSDFECAAYILDHWIDHMAQGRSNIAPSKIPWELLRKLITETYGGKIDNEEDWMQLRVLVEKIMVPMAFEEEHRLVEPLPSTKQDALSGAQDGGLGVPSGTTMTDFLSWVNALPEREPPTYLGLPADAEKVLLIGHAEQVQKDVRKVVEILEEGEEAFIEEST